ncbi:hypothetical protein HHI36_000254 [Cryptolaemus montrouzieri]|uniref:Uncharacterized protein n=1 Tax=Cryptolaemus montrouzieri TaxID=559131 RepID=A0ABD2P4K4_9CUCU
MNSTNILLQLIKDWLKNVVRNPNAIAFFLSDETEATGIIKELKNNKASMDEIKAEILKKLAPFILTPLTYLMNESMKTGIFPGTLKHAVIYCINLLANQK